jgi:DNA-binding IclR family transcriptional regulator
MDAVIRDLDATRERGYAVDDEQNTEGVTCIAVAFPGRQKAPAAVSATMLTARCAPEVVDLLVRDLRTLAACLARFAAP